MAAPCSRLWKRTGNPVFSTGKKDLAVFPVKVIMSKRLFCKDEAILIPCPF